jgi:hypothetical protein
MLHTGTGNDQQASDDFLTLYELYTPLPVEPGYQSYPITSPFRLTAHATIAIGLLITSRASCVTLCCELESALSDSHKVTKVLKTVLRTHPLPKKAACPDTVPCGWRSSQRSSSVAVPLELL